MTGLEAQQLLQQAECIASEETVQAVLVRLAGEIEQPSAMRFRWCCR